MPESSTPLPPTPCNSILTLEGEIIFATDVWRCSTFHCSLIDGTLILYQLAFVKQEGTRDTTKEKTLTLVVDSDVLTTRTPAENVHWLRSLFLDEWLDGLSGHHPHWRITVRHGVEKLRAPLDE